MPKWQHSDYIVEKNKTNPVQLIKVSKNMPL